MHILVFGDSITQGFYDTEKGGWVNRLIIDVSASLAPTDKFVGVFNLGIDSETTTGLRSRIEDEIIARKSADMVIVLDTGGNDTFKSAATGQNAVPFATFSQNYAALVTTAKQYGHVFCMGLHDFNPEQAQQSSLYDEYDLVAREDEQYDREIERLANIHGVHYISMRGLLATDFQRFSHDGDHPSSSGHQLIFERVKAFLVTEQIL